MAFPVIETTNESSTNTAGTSHVVSLPSGIVAGNLILIIMDIGSTAATLNAHADYTELLDENSANGLKILYRKAVGGESNPTFTSSASTRDATISFRISGAQDPAIQAPQIGTTATGSSATPDPPTVTPTGGAKDYLWIAFYGAAGEEADDDTWSDTPPTNYTPTPPLQKSCGTAGTNLGGLIAAASRQLNAASENPGTFAKDVSAAWRAQTIVIHPAPPNVNGVGDGSFTFSGTGTGQKNVTGTISNNITFSGTGIGQKDVTGISVLDISFSGTANGTKDVSGAIATNYTFAGTASGEAGTPPVEGQASGSFNFAGTSTGVRNINSTAIANFSFAGTAQGTKEVTGSAITSITFGSTAVGAKTVSGQIGQQYNFDGISSGVRGILGSSALPVTFTGSATGQVFGQQSGQAELAVSFSGTATGQRGSIGLAAGSYNFVGGAEGEIVLGQEVFGVAVGNYLFNATGLVPPPIRIDAEVKIGSNTVVAANNNSTAYWKQKNNTVIAIINGG